MPDRFCLAIEISNPASGPRGRVVRETDAIDAGPGVALARISGADHEYLGTELLGDQGRHDDDLMPAIDRLCTRHSARPRDLGRIAVSIGPGGYTSIRIAIATAKMLAEATGAEVIPVPSWRVAAWCLPIDSAPALVCVSSKNDSAWAALLPESEPLSRVRADSGATSAPAWWSQHGRHALRALVEAELFNNVDAAIASGRGWLAAACPLGLITAEQVRMFKPRTIIADRFLPGPILAAAAELNAAVVEPIFAARSVLSIAQHTDPIDPLALAPLYPREADAVTQWRRLHPS